MNCLSGSVITISGGTEPADSSVELVQNRRRGDISVHEVYLSIMVSKDCSAIAYQIPPGFPGGKIKINWLANGFKVELDTGKLGLTISATWTAVPAVFNLTLLEYDR